MQLAPDTNDHRTELGRVPEQYGIGSANARVLQLRDKLLHVPNCLLSITASTSSCHLDFLTGLPQQADSRPSRDPEVWPGSSKGLANVWRCTPPQLVSRQSLYLVNKSPAQHHQDEALPTAAAAARALSVPARARLADLAFSTELYSLRFLRVSMMSAIAASSSSAAAAAGVAGVGAPAATGSSSMASPGAACSCSNGFLTHADSVSSC